MENLIKSNNLTAVREVDFVSRFTRDIGILRELLGSIRLEKLTAGTQLSAKSAVVTLNSTAVGEGEVIPYNKIEYSTIPIGILEFDKQAVGVSLEAIAKHGYNSAIQAADDDMMYRLEARLMNKFTSFLLTGTLTKSVIESDFQMALAEALGQVQSKWEDMDKGYSGIIGFCNTLDAYRYLGASNITVQNDFGMTYLSNFLGFSRLFLSSRVPFGKIVATPADNIVMSYIDATDNDFTKAGFNFRTDGDLNLIAVHVNGNHHNMVSDLITVTGISITAEYIDGIAVIDFSENKV
ncbi:MAG: hypothetical protein K2G36_01460 [Ruminococcus sp.]|nr:hypothetical protein [Ruminococcus sp.]